MVKPIFILLLLVSCGSAQGQVQIRVDSTRINDPKYQSHLRIKEMQSEGTVMFLQQAPTYNGDLRKFVEDNLVYSCDELQGEDRKCFVYFDVDTVGCTFNHQILRSTGIESLDAEALRVARLIKFDAPAYAKKDYPIYVDYVVPFSFKLHAQDVEYQQIARRVFSKCIKRSEIYPKEKYDKSFFDNVSLHPIPLCEINGDSLTVIHDKCPYLIIISKDDQYVGVVSTDDCGNSYIDIEYNYKYKLDLWPIWRIISSCNKIWLCNIKGINDQIVFTYHNKQIKYLDVDSLNINDDSEISIEKFVPYKIDEYPRPGLFYKSPDQNNRHNLRHTDWLIKYD